MTWNSLSIPDGETPKTPDDQRTDLPPKRHGHSWGLVGASEKPRSPDGHGDNGDMLVAFHKYLFQDEPWRDQAKCAEPGSDVELDDFFPVRGASQKKAKAICLKCPVKVECDNYATRSNSTYGIWGGRIRHRGKVDDGEE